MKTNQILADEQLLSLFGERLAGLRLARNLTQKQLAEQAGVGLSTVQRLESGAAATQLSGFLRVCRALGVLERLERLLPEPGPSPIEELKRQGQKRQRATGTKCPSNRKTTWTWGDES